MSVEQTKALFRGLIFLGYVIVGVSCRSESPSIEAIELEVDQLKAEQIELPMMQTCLLPPNVEPFSLVPQDARSHWVQIDLERTVTPDLIAMIPNYQADGRILGFPGWFSLELSDSEDFAEFHSICNFRASGYEPNEQAFPIFRNESMRSGRFLRLTVYLPSKEIYGNRPLSYIRCRFSELMIFCGEENVALGKKTSNSHPGVAGDEGGSDKLVDGWSQIGLPVDARHGSFCEGYHSAFGGKKRFPDEPYWVGIDLGRSLAVGQINLLPVTPKAFGGLDGYGFPLRFHLEISNDPNFTNSTVILDHRDKPILPPGMAIYSISGKELEGRYVRMVVPELISKPHGMWLFSLAEMQVISGGRNVSENQRVIANSVIDDGLYEKCKNDLSKNQDYLDADTDGKEKMLQDYFLELFKRNRPHWSRCGLVDGFSSKNRLISTPAWLKGIAERAAIERKLAELSDRRRVVLAAGAQRAKEIRIGLLACAVIFVLSLVVWILWQNQKQKRQLRTRLAQDLHDDLSSDLCNIALMAELLQNETFDVSELRTSRLQSLEQAARKSMDSVRHLVFLTKEPSCLLADLLDRIEALSVEQMAPFEIELDFKREGQKPGQKRLSGTLARTLCLVCKESLTNVIKHAKAKKVTILVKLMRRKMEMTISDNGIGFNLEEGGVSERFGLKSMEMRVRRVQGDFKISTDGAKGTTVKLTIPL